MGGYMKKTFSDLYSQIEILKSKNLNIVDEQMVIESLFWIRVRQKKDPDILMEQHLRKYTPYIALTEI